MTEFFLHGVEVLELDDGPRPIRTVRSSVIGIVGTAPTADATKFPLNTPVLIAAVKPPPLARLAPCPRPSTASSTRRAR